MNVCFHAGRIDKDLVEAQGRLSVKQFPSARLVGHRTVERMNQLGEFFVGKHLFVALNRAFREGLYSIDVRGMSKPLK